MDKPVLQALQEITLRDLTHTGIVLIVSLFLLGITCILAASIMTWALAKFWPK